MKNIGTDRDWKKVFAARNAKFLKLSPEKQRVAIAQDVIKQLEAEKYLAGSTYFQPRVSLDWSKGELAEAIEKPGAACKVCGIGALMVSACRFVDKLTVREADLNTRYEIHDYLDKYFSSEQLTLIEYYFEASNKQFADMIEDRVPEVCREQFEACAFEKPRDNHPIVNAPTRRSALRRIMENIVSNKGTFSPNRGKWS